jgi:hypothetical protein
MIGTLTRSMSAFNMDPTGVTELVRIASKISEPLALSGLITVFLYLIFRGVLGLRIFPKLNAALAGTVIIAIINRIFVLAIVAMVLGFFGFLVKLVAAQPPQTVIMNISKGMTLRQAADEIADRNGGCTVAYRACDPEVLSLEVRPGPFAAATSKNLIENLQFRLLDSKRTVSYNVAFESIGRLYEFTCAPTDRLSASTPAPTPAADAPQEITSSIGLKLRWVGLLRIWVGEYEVTQTQFSAVTGSDPSLYKGPRKPVDKVCFPEAERFCEELTSLDRAAGILKGDMRYRLPRDDEFEVYAAGSVASEAVTSLFEKREGTANVGSFAPNRFGLYDVIGNVWEWMANGTLRGACWDTTNYRDAEIGYRLFPNPKYNCQNFGFRCVLTSEGGEQSTTNNPSQF